MKCYRLISTCPTLNIWPTYISCGSVIEYIENFQAFVGLLIQLIFIYIYDVYNLSLFHKKHQSLISLLCVCSYKMPQAQWCLGLGANMSIV